MTQRGEGMRALGAAYTSSAIGGVLGAFSLAVSVPLIKPIILAFGPPEFFMLGALGLTYVGALSGRSVSKGILAALFGLLLSTIGYSTQGGVARYTFEINYLLDGLELVPVILGLFAIPELDSGGPDRGNVGGDTADSLRLATMTITADDLEAPDRPGCVGHGWMIETCHIIGRHRVQKLSVFGVSDLFDGDRKRTFRCTPRTRPISGRSVASMCGPCRIPRLH